jgi:hypothetical protein
VRTIIEIHNDSAGASREGGADVGDLLARA